MLNVALLCVDAGHTDHLHARTEVAAWGHIIIDFHRASFLGQCTDSLLWWHTDVIVVRHHYSSSWNTEMEKKKKVKPFLYIDCMYLLFLQQQISCKF